MSTSTKESRVHKFTANSLNVPSLHNSFKVNRLRSDSSTADEEEELQAYIRTFVYATGGGEGYYEDPASGIGAKTFHQNTNAMSGHNCLGFGRLRFPKQDLPASYIRVPWKMKTGGTELCHTHPQVLLYYMENVWNLQRPRMLISITGGAVDFPMNEEKERVLYKLLEAARHTDAWLVTGGSNSGIMKYVGINIFAPQSVPHPFSYIRTIRHPGSRHRQPPSAPHTPSLFSLAILALLPHFSPTTAVQPSQTLAACKSSCLMSLEAASAQRGQRRPPLLAPARADKTPPSLPPAPSLERPPPPPRRGCLPRFRPRQCPHTFARRRISLAYHQAQHRPLRKGQVCWARYRLAARTAGG